MLFILAVNGSFGYAMVIERSQRVFHLKGFGFIDCSLRIFSNVSEAIKYVSGINEYYFR